MKYKLTNENRTQEFLQELNFYVELMIKHDKNNIWGQRLIGILPQNGWIGNKTLKEANDDLLKNDYIIYNKALFLLLGLNACSLDISYWQNWKPLPYYGKDKGVDCCDDIFYNSAENQALSLSKCVKDNGKVEVKEFLALAINKGFIVDTTIKVPLDFFDRHKKITFNQALLMINGVLPTIDKYQDEQLSMIFKPRASKSKRIYQNKADGKDELANIENKEYFKQTEAYNVLVATYNDETPTMPTIPSQEFLAWAALEENGFLKTDTDIKANQYQYQYPKNIENQLFPLLKERNLISDTKNKNGLYEWKGTNALLGYLADKVLGLLNDRNIKKFAAIEGYIKRPRKTPLSKSLSQQDNPQNANTVDDIIEEIKLLI